MARVSGGCRAPTPTVARVDEMDDIAAIDDPDHGHYAAVGPECDRAGGAGGPGRKDEARRPGTHLDEPAGFGLTDDEPSAVGAEGGMGVGRRQRDCERCAVGVPDLDVRPLPRPGRQPSAVGAEGDPVDAGVRTEDPLVRGSIESTSTSLPCRSGR